MMTPEFSRQCAVILGSEYFEVEPGSDKFSERYDEFSLLQDEMQEKDAYDEFSTEAKAIWDRAHKVNVEQDAINASVTPEMLEDGYSRLLHTGPFPGYLPDPPPPRKAAPKSP